MKTTVTLHGLGLLSALLLIPPTPALAADPAAGRTEFNRDIRPLLGKHCTACHGGVKNAGKISFIYRDKALAKGKSGRPAIVPGRPEESEVIARILSKDPDEVMPKPDHGPRLNEKEISLLRRWIAEGAEWSEHWSFVPPKEPARPTLRNPAWAREPLDEFILAGLEAEGLPPSPEASPDEWLRRVSFDLIGLPPSPEEYSLYLADRRHDPRGARERVVDRLLASPHFGERWATLWLDLARYSDTYGFEKDPHRDIWPWRDWVIRAFNSDMPFDQFTLRQLAGDLFEHPTADDLLATAFHRNTQNNTEGGTDDEEYRTAAVLDRVNTTWTVWQATTFGCVQCHSHPYDPIPNRDYYRFAAFFNNTEDCDQNDDFPRYLFPDNPQEREAAAAAQQEARRRRLDLNREGLALARSLGDWKPWTPLEAKASGGRLTLGDSGRIDAGGTLPIAVKYTLTLPVVPGLTAIQIQIFPDSENPKRPPERGQIFSKFSLGLLPPGGSNTPVRLKEAIADYMAGPFDPQRVVEGGGGLGSYPVGSDRREGVIVLEKPLEAPEGSKLVVEIEHGIAANSDFQGCPLKHFSLSTSTNARATTFVTSPARMEAWKAWHHAVDASSRGGGVRVPILVERERAATRETRVFIRGNRLTRDEVVSPGIPDVVNPPRKEGPLTRLDMARWLVGNENPLAARVLANRLWAALFGHGIVETLEDFGASGAKPTHPELLDHLALRLRGEFGWSVKRFLRSLALSATYGQTGHASQQLQDRDPANHLLARGPRVRLTAEMVRDQSLALSGLLSPKAFGPPVFPPQPDGVWRTVYSGASWRTAQDENRFRRALYTYSKRTAGYPMFLTFDAPSRDACTARRIPSNTPLQALTTWSDPAFIEMAQGLALRMEAECGPTREKIEFGCRLVTLEPPSRSMVDTLMKLYEGARQDYLAAPDTTSRLAPGPDRAALVLVANTLLNLDITLNR